MAKITRKTQKVFAGSVSASGNIAVFGSLATGSPAYSTDPDSIQTTAYLQGWQSATVGNNSPALQDDNALNFLFSRQLAYLLQQGIAEWDAATEYHQHSFASSGGVAYRSLTNNNTGNAVTDTNNWTVAFAPKNYLNFLATATAISITGGNNTWQTYDLSASIPAGATAVIIQQNQDYKTSSGPDCFTFLDFARSISAGSPVGQVYIGLRSNDNSTNRSPNASMQGVYPITTARTIGIKRNANGSPSPTIAVIGYYM